MNDAKAFFDTNILLYLYGSDVAKQRRALALFDDHVRSDRLVISTQVVQEFYAAGQRKLHMEKAALRSFTLQLLELPLITIQQSQIRAALQLEERYEFPSGTRSLSRQRNPVGRTSYTPKTSTTGSGTARSWPATRSPLSRPPPAPRRHAPACLRRRDGLRG